MKPKQHIKFGSPVTYEIKVQGNLKSSWSDRLAGMNIETEQTEENFFTSTLTGLISDQAALSGILNTLYEMHFPVLSVKNIEH